MATIGQAQAAEQAVPIEVAPDRYVSDDATWPIVSRQTNADGTEVVVRRAPADSPMVKAEIAEGCGTKAVQAGWTCKFSHLDSRNGD